MMKRSQREAWVVAGQVEPRGRSVFGFGEAEVANAAVAAYYARWRMPRAIEGCCWSSCRKSSARDWWNSGARKSAGSGGREKSAGARVHHFNGGVAAKGILA